MSRQRHVCVNLETIIKDGGKCDHEMCRKIEMALVVLIFKTEWHNDNNNISRDTETFVDICYAFHVRASWRVLRISQMKTFTNNDTFI